MKGIVLAGGTGSRLRPLTHTGPKQLIPIANKPVLAYAIEDLVDAGVREIGVILGHTGRSEIQSYVGDGERWDADITYIVQGEPLGLAHAVGCTQEFVGEESFVVYLGDDLLEDDISPMIEVFDPNQHAAAVGLQAVDEPSRYGIVDLQEGGDIARLVEKPENPPSNLALVGIYVFTPAIFEQIDRLEKSWRGEYEITDAIQGLLDDGNRIQSHVLRGWWKDAGTPEDVLHANRLVLDNTHTEIEGTIERGDAVTGRIVLGEGSTVESTATVRGPVSIGTNTRIGPNTYLGPYTSIGDECEIEHAQIEHSVVMDGAEIVGDGGTADQHMITDSLIGRDATIREERQKRPRGNRLVVGANAAVRF